MSDGQSLEAQDGAVLILFPSLKHDQQLVSVTFQKVRVLETEIIGLMPFIRTTDEVLLK